MCLASFFIIASCLAGCRFYLECASLDVGVFASVSLDASVTVRVSHWVLALQLVSLSGCQLYSEYISLDVSVIARVSR